MDGESNFLTIAEDESQYSEGSFQERTEPLMNWSQRMDVNDNGQVAKYRGDYRDASIGSTVEYTVNATRRIRGNNLNDVNGTAYAVRRNRVGVLWMWGKPQFVATSCCQKS